MKFYPFWYPMRWVGRGQLPGAFAEFGRLAKHLRYAERHARKLGRSLFHAMVRYGPKLERKQMVLFRAVDIGAELFAIAATCSRARLEAGRGNKGALALADVFCREARLRVDDLFENLFGPTDDSGLQAQPAGAQGRARLAGDGYRGADGLRGRGEVGERRARSRSGRRVKRQCERSDGIGSDRLQIPRFAR